jgi:hypothetical protein
MKRMNGGTGLLAVLVSALWAGVQPHALAALPQDEAAQGAPATAAKPEAAEPPADAAGKVGSESDAAATAAAVEPAKPVMKVQSRPTAFAVRYMMRDMETIGTVLQLDSMQVSIVEAMLGDYLAASSVSRPVNEYPALAEEFRSNVRAVLSEEQFARWPEVDAAIRRSRLSIGATLPGEGIDVVGLVSGVLEAHERDGRDFVAVSQEYSLALDPLLARRGELMDALRVGASTGMSEETLRARRDEIGPLRAEIRDLNEQTLERIAMLLSAERGALLRDRLFRMAYPSVYSAGEAESLVRRAREEVGNDAEAQQRIELIAGVMETRLAEARSRAIVAVRMRSEFAAGVRGSMSAEQVDEAIKASEKELMDVDDWVTDTLLVEMPESSALAADLRAMMEGRDRYRRMRESNGWGNPEATVREFDTNGDGVLDSAEADMVFRTYTRNVSRFAKYRL